jgi:hypothetical protein
MANGLKHQLNELSPFIDLPPTDLGLPRDFIVDERYGQVYESWVESARGVYGITEQLPISGFDRFANRGFLRVPFRRIPRIGVPDRKTLGNLLNSWRRSNPDVVMLLRGQTREYLIARDESTLDVLYGDVQAMEPSLLPSAERAGVDFDLIMTEWLTLLDFFLLGNCPSEEQARLMRFAQTYDRLGLGMAMAQHYGLPSVGLDVTAAIDIALFCALTDCVFDAAVGGYVTQRVDARATPVLYVFMAPDRFACSRRGAGRRPCSGAPPAATGSVLHAYRVGTRAEPERPLPAGSNLSGPERRSRADPRGSDAISSFGPICAISRRRARAGHVGRACRGAGVGPPSYSGSYVGIMPRDTRQPTGLPSSLRGQHAHDAAQRSRRPRIGPGTSPATATDSESTI